MDTNEKLVDTFRATKRERRPAVKIEPCTRPSKGPNASFKSASTVAHPPKRVDKRANRRRIRKRSSPAVLPSDLSEVMNLLADDEVDAFLLTIGDVSVDVMSSTRCEHVRLECDEVFEDPPFTPPLQRIDRMACISPLTLPTAAKALCTPPSLISHRRVDRVSWSPPTKHALRTTICGPLERRARLSFSFSNNLTSPTAMDRPPLRQTNLFSRFAAAKFDAPMPFFSDLF